MLTRVTMTGADDGTKIDEMVALWREFPFIEWGILIGSTAGDRFPSDEWIVALVEAKITTMNTMPLSLHLCGSVLREIASTGKSSLGKRFGSHLLGFQRCQLNWHGEKQPYGTGEKVLSAFCEMGVAEWDVEIIFQLDGVNDELWLPAGRRFACSGLFDMSHGAGVLPRAWPKSRQDIACGWAGGLGPDNLAVELPKIAECAYPIRDYWIDMEAKIRSDGGKRFCLDRVRACAEIAADFMAKAKR